MTRRFTTGSATHPVSEPTHADDASGGRRLVMGLAWTASLVAIIWLLGRLGTGTLSTPPLLDRSDLQRWLDGRDAITVAFALVRLIGLALAWYLLAVTVLGLAARVSRIPALVRLADVTTIPAVRKVLGTIAGVGLTASAASLAAASMLPDAQTGEGPARGAVDSAVVLERLPDGSDVVLRRLPDQGEEGTATMRVDDQPADEAPIDPAPSSAHQWTVASGDHLWHVAESTLGQHWGRAPTDAEVTPYWSAVVEANRSTLADPDNPDLIFPGQVFVLPDPPPVPPAA